MKSMGTKYSNRRNKMSIHFNLSLEAGSYEDAKRKPYKSVSREDWDWLCDHVFSSESFKKRSAAGAKAREATAFNHCGGSKSHVVHRAEVCSFIYFFSPLFCFL
ncbi:hypothetical protein MKW92_048210 [Papaver armeniacum]|nr:hypothetical protein MKW92_020107 [Papaver armeniacum]KAI3856583.1 hypothetical protein MKW92_048210 [Papaver armeniacum]